MLAFGGRLQSVGRYIASANRCDRAPGWLPRSRETGAVRRTRASTAECGGARPRVGRGRPSGSEQRRPDRLFAWVAAAGSRSGGFRGYKGRVTTSSGADEPGRGVGNADDGGGGCANWEFAAVLQSTIDEADAIASRVGSAYHIPTGFPDLDDLAGGLRRGSLTVVGAHPGVGSSTLASDFIRGAAMRHGVPSAHLTLDDTAEAVTQRLLCAEAEIRLADMRTGRMTDEDWTRFARGVTAIHEKPVVITRLGDPDIAAVEDTVTTLTAAQDTQLVIVDSLHMVTARRDVLHENREREVAEVTRRLKRLALDHNIAVVATVQLSFNPGPRQPVMPAPSLADLRDSGTVAHVADNVLLIYRPDAWDRNDPRAGEADLILAKHRHGQTATFVLAQQLHWGRFVTLAC